MNDECKNCPEKTTKHFQGEWREYCAKQSRLINLVVDCPQWGIASARGDLEPSDIRGTEHIIKIAGLLNLRFTGRLVTTLVAYLPGGGIEIQKIYEIEGGSFVCTKETNKELCGLTMEVDVFSNQKAMMNCLHEYDKDAVDKAFSGEYCTTTLREAGYID